ncbi:MAG: VPLPA-CTERM sorting domain-containing protein [Thiogranum sp.]|nr:VPLPA-CTERM sorting domain-containing protein [Thiogranum sp.]
MGNPITRLAASAALSLCASQAFAAFCQDNYGSSVLTALEGTTVCFVYDSNDIDPVFGTISVSGNTIFSTPTAGFRAESNDGVGIHTNTNTDNFTGIGTIQIIAKPGAVFDSIVVREVGDYRMTSNAGSVDVDGELRVWDWNDFVFGPDQTTNLAINGDLTIKDSNTHQWDALGSFNLGTAMWQGIDHLGLKLQNNLSAVTDSSGQSAWIEKKIIGGITVTTVVPVPAAVWLFASGLLGLAGIARRRS